MEFSDEEMEGLQEYSLKKDRRRRDLRGEINKIIIR